jgi:predicted metal-dependent hydrolase
MVTNNQIDRSAPYSTIYRDIRYPRLEFKTGNLVLVLPKRFDGKEELLERHKKWVGKKVQAIADVTKSIEGKRIKELGITEFRDYVHERSVVHCNSLHTEIGKIYFKKMRTKWASCSSQKNLVINTLGRFLPKELTDYVVFHEIAHTNERRHNDRFWKVIEKSFPKHQEHERDLFAYWFLLKSKAITD